MARPMLVVVGGSAGGVEALLQLVGHITPRFPAPIVLVLHSSSAGLRFLPGILARASPLRAMTASDGEVMRPGTIYVPPSDRHLLVRGSHVHVVHGAKENGHRPAVDPLFRSAAASYDEDVVGVVLSGALDDGTAGLAAIVARGGTAVVQDPGDALFANMPRSAIAHVPVHHIAPAAKIAAILEMLVTDGDVGGVEQTVRSLQERATLAEQLAERARARGGRMTAERFDAKAAEARERSELIREALLSATEPHDGGSAGEDDGGERTEDIEEAG